MKILEKIVDRNRKEFELWFSVWQHIQGSRPGIDSTIILKEVLQNPDFIVCSNWETAYTADKVKIGEIKWKKEI